MKIDQLFESVPKRGQTSVGTRFVTYKTLKKGNMHLISVSTRSNPVGSIKIEGSNVHFMDSDGEEVMSTRKYFSEPSQDVIESLIGTLVELVGAR